MKNGLITVLVGAAVYLAAALLLPWQRFELAALAPTSLALTSLAWLPLVVVLAIAGAAAWALASRRRVIVARVALAACLAVATWLVYAQANRAWDHDLMAHEGIVMDLGFVLAVVGLLVMFVGAGTAVALAPSWDETMAVVRLRATVGGTPSAVAASRELIVYEPRRLTLGVELGVPALDALPLEVTREAEVRIGATRVGRVAIEGPGGRTGLRRRDEVWLEEGDRAEIGVGEVELRVDYVHQPRHVARRLVRGSEIVGIALGALLVFLAAGVATVLATDEEAPRLVPDVDRRVATITALTQEERRADDGPTVIDTALAEASTVAKAAGGDEGRFGDPEIAPARAEARPTTPRRAAAAPLERLDPRKLGLLEAFEDPRVDRAVAEVVDDDRGALEAKLAALSVSGDDAWSLGPGTNGLSLSRDGDGGPGDGQGRLLGLGPIDTGPGSAPAVATSLGPRVRRPVPRVEVPAPTLGGDVCSRQAIDSVVRRRVGAIRACYEQRLQTNAALQGKVVTRWTIGADGRVVAADAIQDSLGDTAVTQCVLRVVRNMRFPEPEGQGLCVVQYPFVFDHD